MDTAQKLALLGSAARYEIADQQRVNQRQHAGKSRKRPGAGALCMGETADGRSGTLLRVLQSSRCEHDCAYCPLRRSNDPERTSFAPEELASTFAEIHQRGRADGLLLSSATDGTPDQTMAQMLDTLRLLRTRHAFSGYVHLKALPGASRAALEEAALLADRISLNVEVPGPEYLSGLQTGKRWDEDIAQRLTWLAELDQAGAIHSGLSSQLMIGVAAQDGITASDRALSESSRQLRSQYALRRVHFGDFVPTIGTPLAEMSAPDPRRRARLYQLDWLATQYDFSDTEIDTAFDLAGNLPLALDPKLVVSLANPQERPVEIGSASYEDLLRVPGIGQVTARRIVDYRTLGTLRDLQDLRALGVIVTRAAPFVLFNGRRPPEAPGALQHLQRKLRSNGPQPTQLRLFPDEIKTGWLD